MSLINNNPILKGISGMLGNTVVFRMWRGRLIMSNRPRPRASNSEKQKVIISRFKEAAGYAVEQMKNAEAKAEYKKGINFKKHSAYLVALSDYLNPPTVDYINTTEYQGAAGDAITIKAKDDFMVTHVKVQIVDATGVLLEQGEASPYFRRKFIWKYQASMMNPGVKGTVIKVTAFDKPGHSASAEIVL